MWGGYIVKEEIYFRDWWRDTERSYKIYTALSHLSPYVSHAIIIKFDPEGWGVCFLLSLTYFSSYTLKKKNSPNTLYTNEI